jgi:hypothetical protein
MTAKDCCDFHSDTLCNETDEWPRSPCCDRCPAPLANARPKHVGDHTMRIDLTDNNEARAVCDCGWRSRAREILISEDYEPIESAWSDHCDTVFMQATGSNP